MIRKEMTEKVSASLPRPKRRFGQNFLVDPGYCSKIVALADIGLEDVVVEIGPGRGAITKLLAEKGCQVFALEIDKELFHFLSDEFEALDNVNILSADATKFDFDRLGMGDPGIGQEFDGFSNDLRTTFIGLYRSLDDECFC